MSIRSDRVCKRPWNFERVPNKMLQGHDKALIFTSTKEACLAACLNEVRIAQMVVFVGGRGGEERETEAVDKDGAHHIL